MLGNIVRTDLQKFIFKIFHVLHCALVEDVNSKVVFNENLLRLLLDFIVIYSAKQSNSFITNVFLSSHALKFHIHRLKLDRFAESCMESRKHRASRIYFIAEFSFELVLLHVVKLCMRVNAIILKFFILISIWDSIKILFLFFADFSLLEKTLLSAVT
jgi:hypothetical protein